MKNIQRIVETTNGSTDVLLILADYRRILQTLLDATHPEHPSRQTEDHLEAIDVLLDQANEDGEINLNRGTDGQPDYHSINPDVDAVVNCIDDIRSF